MGGPWDLVGTVVSTGAKLVDDFTTSADEQRLYDLQMRKNKTETHISDNSVTVAGYNRDTAGINAGAGKTRSTTTIVVAGIAAVSLIGVALIVARS